MCFKCFAVFEIPRAIESMELVAVCVLSAFTLLRVLSIVQMVSGNYVGSQYDAKSSEGSCNCCLANQK